MQHFVEFYADETPGIVAVGSGGAVLEVVNPMALVEVVEAPSTPIVVELITAGGQGPPGPAGPAGVGDADDIDMDQDPVAWFNLFAN
ncbi:MAG: hypothetical protein Q7J45_00615 [bacterium]|nr:hypothetical protein [bacterium]